MSKYLVAILIICYVNITPAANLTLTHDSKVNDYWHLLTHEQSDNGLVKLFISKSSTKEGTYIVLPPKKDRAFKYWASEFIEGVKESLDEIISIEEKPYKGFEAVYISGTGTKENQQFRMDFMISHNSKGYYIVSVFSNNPKKVLDIESITFLNGLNL